ncbi:hypothetical protein PsorP6_001616 [Peronosclerospora sorghi]|uniref:Uncharacterized protein n=1 Tax=Peronosclerospora sorghi TaxID=230839 RepID=A0ACC0WWI4_9STRA|nr:hypothetical protein PsorP6_001616 [Peronosclerospora sorghi]
MGLGRSGSGRGSALPTQWDGSGHNVATQNFLGRAVGQHFRPNGTARVTMLRPKTFWVGPCVSISDPMGRNVATQNFPGRAAGQCLRPMTRPKTQKNIINGSGRAGSGIEYKWVGSCRVKDLFLGRVGFWVYHCDWVGSGHNFPTQKRPGRVGNPVDPTQTDPLTALLTSSILLPSFQFQLEELSHTSGRNDRNSGVCGANKCSKCYETNLHCDSNISRVSSNKSSTWLRGFHALNCRTSPQALASLHTHKYDESERARVSNEALTRALTQKYPTSSREFRMINRA